MKLKEFIRQLQEHDQEAEVVFEGDFQTFIQMDEIESIGRSPGSLSGAEVIISISGHQEV